MKKYLIKVVTILLLSASFQANAEEESKSWKYAEEVGFQVVKSGLQFLVYNNLRTFTHEMGHALVAKATVGAPIHVVLGISDPSQLSPDKFLIRFPRLGIHIATLWWSEGHASCGIASGWKDIAVNVAGGANGAIASIAVLNTLPNRFTLERWYEYLSNELLSAYLINSAVNQFLYGFLPTAKPLANGGFYVDTSADGTKTIQGFKIQLDSATMLSLGQLKNTISRVALVLVIGRFVYNLYLVYPYLIESEKYYWSQK